MATATDRYDAFVNLVNEPRGELGLERLTMEFSAAIENGYPPFSYDTGAEVVDASNFGEVVEREAQFE